MLSPTINTVSACMPLVEARPHNWSDTTMFVTVSPNPATKHSVTIGGRKSRKLAYGKLPQSVQYAYCERLIKMYTFHCSENTTIVGTWELNFMGNVHLHMLIDDPEINNISRLQIFRREISIVPLVARNIKNGKDYMNNIVFIDKPIIQIAEYMDKDYNHNISIYPNYCSYYLTRYIEPHNPYQAAV